MYLMNIEIVSVRSLAEKFEVSVRTIQRDIDSLTLSGIPIVSVQGSIGGYGIMESFKLDKQIMNMDDFFFIIKALKSLCSGYENNKLENTLEKILAIIPTERSTELEK